LAEERRMEIDGEGKRFVVIGGDLLGLVEKVRDLL
jgi:hypothetical protein